MKYWEIIADNLKRRGWSLDYVSAIDSNGRTIWIADAYCERQLYNILEERPPSIFPQSLIQL